MPKEEENDKESFAFEILGINVYANRHQYRASFKLPANSKKDTAEKLFGYYNSLANVLSGIRDWGLKQSTNKSKTLDIAIEKMAAFDAKFETLLKPLKKLEDK